MQEAMESLHRTGAGLYEVVVHLCHYGHILRKTVQLVGSAPWLPNLALSLPLAQPVSKGNPAWFKGVSKTGRKQVTGKAAGLSASAIYPVAFAREIVRQHLGISSQVAPKKRMSGKPAVKKTGVAAKRRGHGA